MSVRTEDRDGVLVITINRPQARNAVNAEVAQGIAAAVRRLDSEGSLAVGVLTGAGGNFSAGMDLKAFLAGESPSVPGNGFGGLTEATVRKPLVAAVDGWALGGGFELALSCDLIVAAEDARFGLPEVSRGLVAGAGGVIRLPQRLPHHLAMELLLTGDPLPAGRAAEFGLVNRIVPSGQSTVDAAIELAQRVRRNAPLALAAVKQIVRASQGVDDATAFTAQRELTASLASSEDVREGARAFAEKRTPVWKGR
ncbi:crotonase/enoyl-CoA hydratase family protein [Kutzneria albida]|uniref:Enoyl-CoA hydratase n=1 Tax=Kutzneria albida DSM 43870 TaxID=1449976 RepID=W5W5K8_9PSEU|nr:crotonase/enoyl-CoA hydratase family protein [Kutzneria albida]AHH96060.1 enoyl-CoA hydratase [Kutzneria albida DSM 43870]